MKCIELFPQDPDVYECQTANCTALRYEGLRPDQMKSNCQLGVILLLPVCQNRW